MVFRSDQILNYAAIAVRFWDIRFGQQETCHVQHRPAIATGPVQMSKTLISFQLLQSIQTAIFDHPEDFWFIFLNRTHIAFPVAERICQSADSLFKAFGV